MTRFSFQLYSARNFPPWAEILKMVAAAGYKQVEGFGALYADRPRPPSCKGARRQRPHDAQRPFRHRPAGKGVRRRLRSPRRSASSRSTARTSCPTSARTPAPAGAPSASGCKAAAKPTRSRLRLRLAQPRFRVQGAARRLAAADRDLRGGARHRLGDGRRLGDPRRRRPAEMDRRIRRPHHRRPRQGHRAGRRERQRGRLGRCRPRHGRLARPDQAAFKGEAAAKIYVMEHDNPERRQRFARRSIEAAKNY